ncbi:hypothetical protein LCGC14_0843990 [marine sediment metagenome]|uniref:Uncharacterized protein n=1 Tax=marine sediment metagenome TaxID=412755 RepID=A0A0F9PH03_9ZZZZ
MKKRDILRLINTRIKEISESYCDADRDNDSWEMARTNRALIELSRLKEEIEKLNTP